MRELFYAIKFVVSILSPVFYVALFGAIFSLASTTQFVGVALLVSIVHTVIRLYNYDETIQKGREVL